MRSLENVQSYMSSIYNLHYLTKHFYEDKIHLDSTMIYFFSFRVFYSLRYKIYNIFTYSMYNLNFSYWNL